MKMIRQSFLLFILFVILITVSFSICNADDSCTLKQGIAFVIDQPWGAGGFGHVAVGFQKCDGGFFYQSLETGNYIFPATLKAEIVIRNFANWNDTEEWISTNRKSNDDKIKIIRVNTPNPNAALREMNKPENYNLLSSDTWNQETEDNCLTYTIQVLTAYGVKDLPASPPSEAPNMYFWYIPGKEYTWHSYLNRYADIEGNAIDADSNFQGDLDAAMIGSTVDGLSHSDEANIIALHTNDGIYTVIGTIDNSILSNDEAMWTETPLRLKDGYELDLESVDIYGERIFIQLIKDGTVVDCSVNVVDSEAIASPDEIDDTYVYANKQAGSTPVIKIHFKNSFRGDDLSLATIDSIWQVSDYMPSQTLVNNHDEIVLSESTPLKLEEGYFFAIKSIDLDGNRIFLELTKDGMVVDSAEVIPLNEIDGTYEYTDNEQADTTPAIKIHFIEILRESWETVKDLRDRFRTA